MYFLEQNNTARRGARTHNLEIKSLTRYRLCQPGLLLLDGNLVFRNKYNFILSKISPRSVAVIISVTVAVLAPWVATERPVHLSRPRPAGKLSEKLT